MELTGQILHNLYPTRGRGSFDRLLIMPFGKDIFLMTAISKASEFLRWPQWSQISNLVAHLKYSMFITILSMCILLVTMCILLLWFILVAFEVIVAS